MFRFNLGQHSRRVSTQSKAAQRAFDQGLNWCFGFNHEEGVVCFEQALKEDPNLAMAHWGVAYGTGPFYNMPWRDLCAIEAPKRSRQCFEHVQKAIALSAGASDVEQALINALAARFQAPDMYDGETFDRWDDAYADAMRGVYAQFPDDLDVAALFIEALMTRTPWKLWDVRTGEPRDGADTVEALDVCERAIAQCDAAGQRQHLAILHLHIHLTEMSQTPERAMGSADILGGLCPDAGHMNHMPGHTYVLCGEYDKARIASEKAIQADNKYVDYAGAFNFYTTARCHDLHLMMYTCMLMGRFEPALAASQQICDTLSWDVLSMTGQPQMVATMEGYFSMKMHVLVRFGRWHDIIMAPMPACPVLYCVSTAMHHYAKGVAFAALKDFEQADEQQRLFNAARARVPDSRKFFNNPAGITLGVGEKMLAGELAYHLGDYDVAFAQLRDSVLRDDALEYTEPWAWMHPPRHALGALLMEQGYFGEAEDVYRADLGLNDTVQRCAQHPNNVWALHGLVECLRRRQCADELAVFEPKLRDAKALADVEITASCLCRGLSGVVK